MDITYVSQGCVYILHTCSTIVSRSGPKITWYRVHDKTNNPFGDRDEDIDLFTQTHTHTRVVGKMKIDNVTPSQRYNRETIHFTQHTPPPTRLVSTWLELVIAIAEWERLHPERT